jgi:hypothetical protein
MIADKIFRRSRVIAAHISEIVLRNHQDDRSGALLPTNAAFREVIVTQERLLNAVERLLEKMPGRSFRQLPQPTDSISIAQIVDAPDGRGTAHEDRRPEVQMKTAITVAPPRKEDAGKVMPQRKDKSPASPIPESGGELPSLRPARGDDDIMSEEPSVPDGE